MSIRVLWPALSERSGDVLPKPSVENFKYQWCSKQLGAVFATWNSHEDDQHEVVML